MNGFANPAPISLSPLSETFTKLWLIRHAEVEARYQKVFGGTIDMDLSPLGHQQAEALAQYLKVNRLDAFYASPMKRVQQTLIPFLNHSVPPPVILPELREVDFGAWTGLNWDQVKEQFGISAYAWLDQLDCDGILNAECATAFRQRLQPCLESLIHEHQGQDVGIVCHGGVIRMALSILLNVPFSKTRIFEIDYASITQVVLERDRASLQMLNFVPWRQLP
jgi:broad specificity phosphatase PhoE